MNRARTRLACLLGLAALSACGPVLKNPTPAAEVQATEAAAYGSAYRLEPGDQLEVRHVLDPDYSGLALVAPDGTITVPGLPAPVPARGLTVNGLTDELNARYRQSNMLRAPFFSVSLRSFASLQVFAGGEVQRPGYLEVTGGDRSVMQVIMTGGGFANAARTDEVTVLRKLPNGKGVIFSVDLRKVLNGEDLAQNVPVRPMDVVFVPKSDVAFFGVWVDQHIRQALPINTSASYSPNNTGTNR